MKGIKIQSLEMVVNIISVPMIQPDAVESFIAKYRITYPDGYIEIANVPIGSQHGYCKTKEAADKRVKKSAERKWKARLDKRKILKFRPSDS